MSSAWESQVVRITSTYGDLVKRYGHDPRACDYGRTESQQIKFAVLSEAMSLRGKRVLDVGCGFADFSDYLSNLHGDLTYEGVDLTPSMITEAHRLHPALSLRVLDILNEQPGQGYDLVTANGIFYLLGENALELMQQLIVRMYQLTSYAVAFNSLSTWATYQEPNEFYADPLATLEFCRKLTPWVVLRHDYLLHDFSVFMYREAPQR